MTLLDLIKETSESAGRLRRAMTYHFEGADHFVEHIVLEFETGHLTLSAVEADDTIALSTSIPAAEECEVRESPTWASAHGSGLFRGWMLTDHQGYPDGVRLEFRNTASDPAVVFEATVAASMLRVFLVQEAG